MNDSAQDGTKDPGAELQSPTTHPTSARSVIIAYLRERVEEFRYLETLRAKVSFLSRRILVIACADPWDFTTGLGKPRRRCPFQKAAKERGWCRCKDCSVLLWDDEIDRKAAA